ncbi:unnamed protein product, partial [Cercopithifilaria johnstoni]
ACGPLPSPGPQGEVSHKEDEGNEDCMELEDHQKNRAYLENLD